MGRSPDMTHLALHLGMSLRVASPFVYFLTAGAKTFTVPARDSGALLSAGRSLSERSLQICATSLLLELHARVLRYGCGISFGGNGLGVHVEYRAICLHGIRRRACSLVQSAGGGLSELSNANADVFASGEPLVFLPNQPDEPGPFKGSLMVMRCQPLPVRTMK
jgi:hypothetical protein